MKTIHIVKNLFNRRSFLFNYYYYFEQIEEEEEKWTTQDDEESIVGLEIADLVFDQLV